MIVTAEDKQAIRIECSKENFSDIMENFKLKELYNG